MKKAACFLSVMLLIAGVSGCASEQLARRVGRLEDKVSSIQKDQQAIEQELTRSDRSSTTAVRPEIIEMPKKINWTKRNIQRALKKGGYYSGSIDGILGKKTGRAIREFQNDHGLKVDGIAGEETRKELREYLL